MKYYSHLKTAIGLLAAYDGRVPFAGYIKNCFRENKKYGSSDRKNIARCCYAFFRMGNALNDLATEEKIFAGLFVTATRPDPLLHFFKPEWPEQTSDATAATIYTRILFLKTIYPFLEIVSIFKWISELSEGIDANSFVLSHLQQPNIFIRIRPGNHEQVVRKLQQLQIPFQHADNDAIALLSGIDLEELFVPDKEIVIQDLNSQAVGKLLTAIDTPVQTVWDCCAGSGGKSIMAVDMLSGIQLTVSDIRESIIENLKKRFYDAGIRKFTSFTSDLTKSSPSLPGTEFDLIIADVPCSGSGTWSRTPEQLIHFRDHKMAQYAGMQKAITANALQRLRPGGWLLYITCSVFAQENEQVIDFLVQNQLVHLVRQELLIGYDKRADTLFAALLRKKR